jgi:hypothetical protein
MLFHALHGAVDDALAELETPDRAALVRALEGLFRRALGLA